MKPALSDLTSTVAVADGAWSTQLRARGLPLDVIAEIANVSHGHLVAALAKEYVQSGAEILTTNTFAANALVFQRRDVRVSVGDVNRAAATIARNIAHDQHVVAGVIGPSGRIVATGEVPEARLREVFAEQAQALAAGGVDWIVLETFTEMAEILIALSAVKAATNLPVIACMSFDSGPQRARTHMGAAAEQAAVALDEAGADAIGCNCGAGIATVLPTVVALRSNTKKPVWVKPSAGLPDLEDGRAVYHITPDDFGGHVPAILDAGASVVGGCCGVGPEHIRRIAALVAARRRKR
jgi:methionine synthase I (cobalamin-dependent)